MRYQNNRRNGFTLTEMMVATALILYIMLIISTAFRSGLDTFSKLSTTGKLQEQLTNTTRIIQRDLAADHFKVSNRDGFQGPKLSDQRLDRIGWLPQQPLGGGGFFAAWQTSLGISEPTVSAVDAEQLGSSRSSNCFMRFTVKMPQTTPLYQFPLSFPLLGAPQRDTYESTILDPTGNGTYYQMSLWGKVAYFLAPVDPLVPVYTDSSNTVQLFSLRRQFTPMSPIPSDSEFEIDRLHWRSNFVPDPEGNDILLTNVLGMEMKYVWDGPELSGLAPPAPLITMPNKAVTPLRSSVQSALIDWPYDDLPVRFPLVANQPVAGLPDRYFDTWFQPSPTSTPPATGLQIPDWTIAPPADASLMLQPPLRIRIKAIQFKLRIWDQKTGQTRQVTIMQEV